MSRLEDVLREHERERSLPLGRYELQAEIGRGGMGVVHRAWDRQLGRGVALKLVADPSQAAPETQPRFVQEAQIGAQLAHPHIIPVYDTGEWNGMLYLAMRLVAGTSVDRAPIDLPAKVAAVRDVARGLDHAHAKGIVHRDVKPSNILVESGGHAYLTDFGIARRTDVPAKVTLTGVVLGTPSYMSPEQARGEAADARADVYALGATLYQLLAGRPPFDGPAVLDILRQVQDEDPVPPRRLNPRVERDLEVIVLKCLEKEPERRYPTAAALADDLDRWLRREPVLARSQSLLYRLRRRTAKYRTVLAVAAAGILGSAVVAAIAGTPLRPAPALAPAVPANERRAVDALRAVAAAEEEFRRRDRDGNGERDYWTGDVEGLRILQGPDGRALELISRDVAEADVAPLGRSIPGRYERPERTLSASPPGGYYYRMLAQFSAEGRVESYLQDTGGTPAMGAVHHRSRFGVCAFPAEYGTTGTRTYIVDERGRVYWMDTRGSPVFFWPSEAELASFWIRVLETGNR